MSVGVGAGLQQELNDVAMGAGRRKVQGCTAIRVQLVDVLPLAKQTLNLL
jgi:hypothetical protein